jgi:hypothetical protein
MLAPSTVVVIAVPGSLINVRLVPGDLEFSSDALGWPDEVRPLLRMLRSHDVDVRTQAGVPGFGEKGAVSEIILALGSSGAIAAAVAVLQSWLNQRSTRTASLTFEHNGRPRTLDLRVTGMSEDATREVLLTALRSQPDAAQPEIAQTER